MVSFGMFRINEIEYTTKEEALKNLIKSRDVIYFNCERCGAEASNEKRRFIGFYCTTCKRKVKSLEKYGVENPTQAKEVVEKRKQTNIKRYGGVAPACSKKTVEKMKQTNLEKYGSIAPMGNKGIQEKSKKTNLEKYGVENVANFIDVQEKKKINDLEKYGVEYHISSNEVREKIKKTNLERYGMENPTQALKNYKRIVEFLNVNFNVITTKEEYKKLNVRNTPLILNCKKCNSIFDFFNIKGISQMPHCPVCEKTSIGGSFEEDTLADFIASIYTGTIERNKRTYLDNKYEIDIYLPELKIGFEYDGIKWHTENFGDKDRNYHLDKQNLANEKGIQLFFIRSDEWSNKKQIIKSIIASKLGVFSNRYYARKCSIKEINGKIANDFLIENHIQGISLASVKIGLFFNEELVSVATFGKSRFNKKYEWELFRYANKLNTSVVGGFSKMLSYFRKKYNPASIITYSDKRYFNKDTYVSSGFTYIGNSNPNYVYTRENSIVGSRLQFQKHKLKEKLEVFNEDFTEWQNMLINNYDRIWDCGNRVFVIGEN